MAGGPLKQFATWKHLAGVAVTGIALWLVLRRVQAAALGEALQSAQFGWFAGAVAVFGIACLLGAWRWHLMLRLTNSAVHVGASLRAFLIGHFFNFFLFGCTAGDVAKAVAYSRWHGVPLAPVVATSPIDRLLGFAGLLIFALIGVVVAMFHNAFGKAGERFWVNPAWLIPVVLIVGIFIQMVRRWRPTSDAFLARAWRTFAEGMLELARQPGLAAQGLLLGFLVQTCFSITFMLSLIAVTDVPLPLTSMLWAFPVISLATLVPSVAGLGVREALAMAVLGIFGVPPADAAAAALLALAANLSWVVVGGFVLWREEHWHEQHASRPLPKTISVVIATHNDAGNLLAAVNRVRALPEVCEIIVSDGGSFDGTCSMAEELGCDVVNGPVTRGGQFQRGAVRAKGDVVLLLHTDTWLPTNAGQAVLGCLADPSVVGGGFWKEFRDADWFFVGSRWRCALRLFLSRRILGDQAMFVRRDALEKVGGVPDQPMMEEFELCRRLQKIGRLTLAPATVTASTRHFEKHGPIGTWWRMGIATLQYQLGVEPQELQRSFEKE